MFGIGVGLILFLIFVAALSGKDAPDAVKITGGVMFLVGVALCCASVAVALWRVMP